jgi:hypothetical protein
MLMLCIHVGINDVDDVEYIDDVEYTNNAKL